MGLCIANGSESDDSQQTLERSLQEFDEKILRELEETQEARQENARQKAALRSDAELETEDESEGQAQNEGEGQDTSAEGSESGGESNETASTIGQEHNNQTSGDIPGDEETAQTKETAMEGQEQQGSSNTKVADIPSGNDDDIVARQLREAAEAETDPEVKEKLWEEYRKYKNQRNPGP